MYNIYAYLELVREYCTMGKPFCVNGVCLLMYRTSSAILCYDFHQILCSSMTSAKGGKRLIRKKILFLYSKTKLCQCNVKWNHPGSIYFVNLPDTPGQCSHSYDMTEVESKILNVFCHHQLHQCSVPMKGRPQLSDMTTAIWLKDSFNLSHFVN